MVLICILTIYILKSGGSIGNSIAILGVFALGAQKMLPMMQQAYASFCQIRSSIPTLIDVLTLIEDESLEIKYEIKNNKIPFNNRIDFKNISFTYKNTANTPILNEINITINKGDKIGVIGKSGSGKSTFLDLFMGLLRPSVGEFKIDNVKIDFENIDGWRTNIAHLPQNVFLIDASIEENIAITELPENIDMTRINNIAKLTLLDDLLKNKEINGFSKKIGENGSTLSGGQRQRIGIARALYNGAKVLIFDEPTSALDSEAEAIIMESIAALNSDYTVIIVAHRLDTLSRCNRIFKVNQGSIEEIKS